MSKSSKRKKKTSASNSENIELLKIKTKRKKEEIKINNIIDISSPREIQFLNNIANDSFTYRLDNTFSVFKSYNSDIIYLIYATKDNSIVSMNLINFQKLCEVRKAHKMHITFFKYFFDKIELRDLILSISGHNNNIKIWKVKNMVCILNIENINSSGDLNSACVLYDKTKNENFIVSSCCYGNSEPLKIFDFYGRKVKEISHSCDNTIFIDDFYDERIFKNFIITGNEGFVKSYDFKKSKTYLKYCDNDGRGHFSVYIHNTFYKIQLFESCEDGCIRIWDFHSRELLNKIYVSEKCLYGICFWDDDYIFVGCSDKSIKLVSLKCRTIARNLTGHKNMVITVKKINHPKYGKCLLSQGDFEDPIKLWTNKKLYKK